MSENNVIHKGSCHCGAVRFEAEAPRSVVVWDCNCTVCHMRRNIHFIIPAARFRILKGKEHLTTYTFNTHTAKHQFCKICGIQSFYIPRSNPDGVAITINCVEPGTIDKVTVKTYNGKNWEDSYDDSGIVKMSKL